MSSSSCRSFSITLSRYNLSVIIFLIIFMASIIESVTASFARTLALASRACGGPAPDLGKLGGGPVCKANQFYLLGRPLTRRAVDPTTFINHFHRSWIVSRAFRIQRRGENIFLASFDAAADRNKVLKGGVWCFDRAPVVWVPYDGVTPIPAVPLNHFRVWVKVSDLPPLFEEPRNFLIGNLLGGFLDYDKKEFRRGQVCILITHEISKPVILEKQIILVPGVEPLLKFEYHRLQGRCTHCALVTHVGVPCTAPVPPSGGVPIGSTSTPAGPPPGFAFKASGTASSAPIPTQVYSSKKKKPVIRKLVRDLDPVIEGNAGTAGILHGSSPTEGDENHIDNGTIDIMQVADKAKSPSQQKKRARHGAVSPSPKKLKSILGERIPVLCPEALGLTAEETESPIASLKKKGGGRILGSKNKVTRPSKKPGPQPPRVALIGDVAGKVSPNKGKGIA